MKTHSVRSRFMPEKEEETNELKFTRHVLGPLKVLAIIPSEDGKQQVTKAFVTSPSGNVLLLYDQSGCNMIENNLCVEDTIICSNAIVVESEDPQYGAYDVQDGIYIVKDGKVFEIPGYESREI